VAIIFRVWKKALEHYWNKTTAAQPENIETTVAKPENVETKKIEIVTNFVFKEKTAHSSHGSIKEEINYEGKLPFEYEPIHNLRLIRLSNEDCYQNSDVKKKRYREIFIEEAIKTDGFVVYLDRNLILTKMLIKAGVKPERLVVVECDSNSVSAMHRHIKENKKFEGMHLIHGYVNDFLKKMKHPFLIWLDYYATYKGNKKCRPIEDVELLRKLAPKSVMVTICQRGRVDGEKASNVLMKDLENMNYSIKESIGYRNVKPDGTYGCTMFVVLGELKQNSSFYSYPKLNRIHA